MSSNPQQDSHTIILSQPTKNLGSRTFTDYESITLAVEGIIKAYELKLSELNPQIRNITYDVRDLYSYIDHLTDICALVFNHQKKAYEPHDKEWIKARILAFLKRAAGQS